MALILSANKDNILLYGANIAYTNTTYGYNYPIINIPLGAIIQFSQTVSGSFYIELYYFIPNGYSGNLQFMNLQNIGYLRLNSGSFEMSITGSGGTQSFTPQSSLSWSSGPAIQPGAYFYVNTYGVAVNLSNPLSLPPFYTSWTAGPYLNISVRPYPGFSFAPVGSCYLYIYTDAGYTNLAVVTAVNLGYIPPNNTANYTISAPPELTVDKNYYIKIYIGGYDPYYSLNYTYISEFTVSCTGTYNTTFNGYNQNGWNTIALAYNGSSGVTAYCNGSPAGYVSGFGTLSPITLLTISSFISVTNLNTAVADARIIQGGTAPSRTSIHTPDTPPYALNSVPTYVSGGTNVLGLSAKYLQRTTMKNTVGTQKIEFRKSAP